jgi:hypothetical protein
MRARAAGLKRGYRRKAFSVGSRLENLVFPCGENSDLKVSRLQEAEFDRVLR